MHEALISAKEVDDFIMVRAIAFVTRIQRAVQRDVLRDEDIPVLEWRLLYSVARLGSCHLALITQKTSIDPAHGSRAVSALEDKGLIVRHTDPENRRRKVISLSDSGKAYVERIWPKVQAVMKSVTDQLDPRDFEEAKRLLDLLNEAAEPLRTKPEDNKTKSDAGSIAAE